MKKIKQFFVKKISPLWTYAKRLFISFRIDKRALRLKDRWCIHSYYTLSPFAPDDSGRILLASADLKKNTAQVTILDDDGKILKTLSPQAITESFWHTGFWQSWSSCGRFIYFQRGTINRPLSIRYELSNGDEIALEGDLEGMCPAGEPGYSSYHGMLYAAGYGDDIWKPDMAPVPFLSRHEHGIFKIDFEKRINQLELSVAQIMDAHPERDRLLFEEKKLQERLGIHDGLTLMCYCVRWNPQGSRFLFYFGNHSVAKSRNEPRIAYVFTADRDLNNLNLAVDLSLNKFGVHWGWQPCGEKLIGYGPRSDGNQGMQLAEVSYDGSGYAWLSDHASGGHPSVSPSNPDLIVTDEVGRKHGNIVFISKSSGKVIHREPLPKFRGPAEPDGRNPMRVCHHPVFNKTGDIVLCNSLPSDNATLVLLKLPKKIGWLFQS